ncbi:MAG: HD domain-containing protein [Clostridia bacterium]|nr:HD domain-containing protein [Clostridia bacterium]
MLKYHVLSKEIQEKITEDRTKKRENPYKCKDFDALRRDTTHDNANLWRPAFVRDIEKILHLPVYNRYADKTQVFSLYHNDDITRRGLHVQFVSRIARNIGTVLGLNIDLIEAIALGHDLGHTPFGHAGERFLSELLYRNTGCYFNHNVHSVRVVDSLYRRNLTIQTLNGILCHNGEFEMKEYIPEPCENFCDFDSKVSECYHSGKEAINKLIPSTLEGCVVRISDMIAYLGKDRQDAKTAKIIDKNSEFAPNETGSRNAEIINNLIVDIIENSYGKDFIHLSSTAYNDLKKAKDENTEIIYKNKEINNVYDNVIKPMFEQMYDKLLDDIKQFNRNSFIFRHHINDINYQTKYYNQFDYLSESPDFIVTDYIASMTDDYFIELYREMFPGSKFKIEYKSYFED